MNKYNAINELVRVAKTLKLKQYNKEANFLMKIARELNETKFTIHNTSLHVHTKDERIILASEEGKVILSLKREAIDEAVDNGNISTEGWGFMGKLVKPTYLHASMIAYAEELGATEQNPIRL